MSHQKQIKIFKRFAEERDFEFANIKDKSDLNNLVYKFSGSENNPIGFTNYQLPWKLFEDLRDGDINPKEVLKNQARFKSDLSAIKIGGNKSVNQKIQ